jgi:hypothetical protein
VIVVLEEADWRLQGAEGVLHTLLNDSEVAVLVVSSETPELSGLEQELWERDLLRPRSLLIQDPYDDARYFEARCSGEEMARSKLHALVEVCQLLGARKVTSSWIEASTTTLQHEVTRHASGDAAAVIGAPVPGAISVTAARSDERGREFTRSMAIEAEYPEGRRDIEAARRYLQRGSLRRDRDLGHLSNAVGDGAGCSRLKLVVDTREIATSALDRIRRLEAPLLRLDAIGRDYASYYGAHSFSLEVEFWGAQDKSDDLGSQQAIRD